DVLKNKNAALIFVSQLVSAICDKMMSIGLIWYLTKEYSINVVPWFLAITFCPHLLMAFYSTHFINKVSALKTVILSEYFRGFVLLILYATIYFVKIEGNSLLIALTCSGFLVSLGSSLFNPAIMSLPPKLVAPEKIVGLNALIDSSMSISTILGATFAIFILNFVDLKTLILINALSFLWAGILQMGLTPLKQSAVLSESKNIIGPLGVLRKYPDVARMLISFLFINLVFTPILVMIPWYVQKIYSGDSSSLALIEGAMGLGAFSTGLYLSFSNFQVAASKRISMIALVSFLFGILFLIFAYSSLTWHGAIVLFLIGILSTFINIQVLTYFQSGIMLEEEVPAIMTAVNIISAASIPLSLVFSGLIFPHVLIPNFAKISGIAILFLALIMPKFLQGSIWKSE
ncbi:MAG: MFS transporter, partial [Bacteriovorax sp.]|nr:MFS transporter [Bacteriovorax sp.]